MFYWSYKDVHVVLSDDEELALVKELSETALEILDYDISKRGRKNIEHRIFSYFKESLHADPEAFNRRFVFRSFYDKDAQKMFPVLLDAYRRITRRAAIGFHDDSSPLEELAGNMYYTKTDVFQITLFERSRWPWAWPVASGRISLPVSSIEKLAGSVDNFFVASTTATIKFHRDFVRISILDSQGRPNKSMDSDEE